jgi:SMI1 / KNR4 family (SUKH-1)
MTIKDRVKAAVERIRKANEEYFSLEFDEDCPQVLNPGASAAQIANVERRLGAPLPPSYRAFLELHNGWTEFTGGAMILPTDEHDKPWVAKRIKRFHDHIREFEKTNVLQHAFFVMLGEDEPNFVFLDKSKRSADGEMEVVHWDLIYGDRGRFPDFAAYLESKAGTVERLVAKAK